MDVPCEAMVREYLPKIRQQAVHELVQKHGFTQMRASKALGITQAAVSKYLSSPCTRTGCKGLNAVLCQFGKEYASHVVSNTLYSFDYTKICTVCPKQETDSFICQIHAHV